MARRTSTSAERDLDTTTFKPGDYGCVHGADGMEQWWVRSAKGAWIALAHQRVEINEDGSLTVLFLR